MAVRVSIDSTIARRAERRGRTTDVMQATRIDEGKVGECWNGNGPSSCFGAVFPMFFPVDIEAMRTSLWDSVLSTQDYIDPVMKAANTDR